MPADLFTREDLEHYLQLQAQPADGSPETGSPPGVADVTYRVIHKLVAGWLRDAAELSPTAVWPWDLTDSSGPVPGEVFGWAVELAAIVHENPSAADRDRTDRAEIEWDGRARVEEVLARVRRWARRNNIGEEDQDAPPRPRGSFPPSTRVDQVDQPYRLYPGYSPLYPANPPRGIGP